MASFIGTDTYAIDHKGRIAVPAWMRRAEAGRRLTRFVVSMGLDQCVAVYSPDEWQRMMAKLRKVSMGSASGRAFRRAFMTDAKEVSVDGQGRITVPPALMRRAALGKEAVLHGAEDHVEIWNPERFRNLLAPIIDVEGEFEKLAAEHLKDEE